MKQIYRAYPQRFAMPPWRDSAVTSPPKANPLISYSAPNKNQSINANTPLSVPPLFLFFLLPYCAPFDGNCPDRPTERPNPILPLLFQLFTCQKCPPLIDPLKLCDCEAGGRRVRDSWQSWFDSQFLVLKESLIRDAINWFYGKTHKTSLDIVNKGFLNHMAWFTV